MRDKKHSLDTDKKPRIQTAARTMDLVVEVARSGPAGINPKTLGEKLGVPRQTVYHLIHTLVGSGMLRRSTANSYILGLSVAPIVHGFHEQLVSTNLLRRYATDAAKITGEAAYVSGWVDDEITVLASTPGHAVVTASVVPEGTTGDAHARAAGKMLLSMCSDDKLQRYLDSHVLKRRTPNTVQTRAHLLRHVKEIRKKGFAAEIEEYALGLSCLAVPIGNIPSEFVLGISAPLERFTKFREKYIEQLREIAMDNGI